MAARALLARNQDARDGGYGVIRGMTYTMATICSAVVILLGYAVLDVAGAAPGILTTAPVPPPPPTETPGKRTLPVVPQPTLSTSVAMPLPSLADDAAAPTPDGVEAALEPVLGLTAMKDSALVVRDGQSGQVLFDRGGDDPRTPASTTKLLSAAAIGQVFGADETLRTVVRAGAEPDEIVLVAGGDSLINPGEGDPDAVSGRAGLQDLSDQVARSLDAEGIDSVTLSVDESYADGPLLAATWGSQFRPLAITGPVSMLGLSTLRARQAHPALADPVASVRDLLADQLDELGIDVTVATRPADLARRATTDNTEIVPAPEPSPSVDATAPAAGLAGSGTAGSSTAGPGTGTDTTDTTGNTGNTGNTDATGTPAPPDASEGTSGAYAPGTVLGSIESAPVRDQLALALTDSDNALTEILARQAAYRAGAGTNFPDVGAWVVEQVAALGVDTTGVTLVDASGLSRENRIPANVLADVLVLGYDGNHPVLRRALDGLPIGGLTGTLAKRFKGDNHDAAGRARAKTGTLTGANALAGSVVDDDGRLLVFVGMVAGTGTTAARAALDRFGATVAACGCR